MKQLKFENNSKSSYLTHLDSLRLTLNEHKHRISIEYIVSIYSGLKIICVIKQRQIVTGKQEKQHGKSIPFVLTVVYST